MLTYGEVILKKSLKLTRKFDLILEAEKPSLKQDSELVDYALSVLKRSFSTPCEYFDNDLEGNPELRKSSFVSEYWRNMGNDKFKVGQMFSAHNLYTLSIAFARTGSQELALAYGNRSAVLFKKQFYKECLEDIQKAFENNYPLAKKAKLLLRQEKAKELLPNQKKVYHDIIPKIKCINKNIPSASDCIKIKKSKKFGRHIVANQTINPGQILLVEKSYSQYVLPDNRTVRCSECIEICYNMIPCEKCAGVLYCSRACRQKAYVDYHRYECAILLHFGFDVIDWNATRLSLKSLKEYYKENLNNNLYHSDRYKEISELLIHKGKKIETIAVIGVAKVFYALKKFTDIFSEFDIDNKESILKAKLLNDVYIVHFNEVLVTTFLDEAVAGVGRAIFSVLALFNHACNENVACSFYGSTVVLRAKKKISEGDQCFINYGVNLGFHNKEIRQSYLQYRYKFTCKCQACEKDWPKEDVLSNQTRRLLIDFISLPSEVFCNANMDNNKKEVLLQKVVRIAEKIEPEAPFLANNLLNTVFDSIMSGKNALTDF